MTYWLEPPTRGQPPKRGQNLCSQSVLYSEVPLYSIVTSHFDTIHDECYSNSEEGDVKDGMCSTKCRNSLEETIDTVGCCFAYWNSSIIESSRLPSDLFSACGIEVPDACSSFRSSTVPDDYLECAGLTINGGATLQSGVYSIGLIIISLIATYI